MKLQNQLFRAAGKKSTVGLRKPAMDRLYKRGGGIITGILKLLLKNIFGFLCEYPVLYI
jgi:hypothetical protein